MSDASAITMSEALTRSPEAEEAVAVPAAEEDFVPEEAPPEEEHPDSSTATTANTAPNVLIRFFIVFIPLFSFSSVFLQIDLYFGSYHLLFLFLL
jgi:hypothetical protein